MRKHVGKMVALVGVPAAIVAGKVILDKLVGEPSTQSGGVALSSGGHFSGEPAPLGGEVSHDLLDLLVCPEDKGPLTLDEAGHYLVNPRNGYRYPIRGGIPIMVIEEGRANKVS